MHRQKFVRWPQNRDSAPAPTSCLAAGETVLNPWTFAIQTVGRRSNVTVFEPACVDATHALIFRAHRDISITSQWFPTRSVGMRWHHAFLRKRARGKSWLLT